jgi:hypothetical protein
MDVRRISKIRRKYNDIINRSFNIVCRGQLRLLFLLGRRNGDSVVSGAAPSLCPLLI